MSATPTAARALLEFAKATAADQKFIKAMEYNGENTFPLLGVVSMHVPSEHLPYPTDLERTVFYSDKGAVVVKGWLAEMLRAERGTERAHARALRSDGVPQKHVDLLLVAFAILNLRLAGNVTPEAYADSARDIEAWAQALQDAGYSIGAAALYPDAARSVDGAAYLARALADHMDRLSPFSSPAAYLIAHANAAEACTRRGVAGFAEDMGESATNLCIATAARSPFLLSAVGGQTQALNIPRAAAFSDRLDFFFPTNSRMVAALDAALPEKLGDTLADGFREIILSRRARRTLAASTAVEPQATPL